LFHALCGQVQELRDGGEVPVGIRDMGMTEIGGELRQVVFDVMPIPIPLQEGLDGEAVTIMPRAA
jgi:hypothetical protein